MEASYRWHNGRLALSSCVHVATYEVTIKLAGAARYHTRDEGPWGLGSVVGADKYVT